MIEGISGERGLVVEIGEIVGIRGGDCNVCVLKIRQLPLCNNNNSQLDDLIIIIRNYFRLQFNLYQFNQCCKKR